MSPVGESGRWFVVNAREAQWRGGNGRTPICTFEGEERFPQVGVNLHLLRPGELGGLYHAEDMQEDFLVLEGECVLLVDGQERPLRRFDFVHCPPGTPHAFVATGGPCLLFQVGARPVGSIVYPESSLASRHGVGAERKTSSVAEAYGPRRREPIGYDGFLDDGS